MRRKVFQHVSTRNVKTHKLKKLNKLDKKFLLYLACHAHSVGRKSTTICKSKVLKKIIRNKNNINTYFKNLNLKYVLVYFF